MEVKEMLVSSLRPYEKNNKKHDKEQILRIANSIKEFWFTQPVVIDNSNTIIIGHGRYEAAKLLELEKIPVVKLWYLTEQQVSKLRILDNKLNESEREYTNLKEELDKLDDFDFWELELDKRNLFPEIKPEEFDEFKEVKFQAKNKEYTEDDLGDFDHTCPKCWFQFND